MIFHIYAENNFFFALKIPWVDHTCTNTHVCVDMHIGVNRNKISTAITRADFFKSETYGFCAKLHQIATIRGELERFFFFEISKIN